MIRAKFYFLTIYRNSSKQNKVQDAALNLVQVI